MFGALIAHEARLQARPLLVASAVALGVGILSMVLQALRVPLLTELAYVTGVAVAAGFWVAVLIWLLIAYGRTMYGRQGYFTMTIPVDGGVLYAAKFVWAWLIGCASLVMSLLLGVLAYAGLAMSQGVPVVEALVATAKQVFSLTAVQGVLLVVTAVLAQAFMTAFWGFVVIVGSGPRFNRYGLGGVVLVGVLAHFVTQVVLFVSILAVPLALSLDGDRPRFVVHWFAESLMSNETPSLFPFGWVPFALVGAGVLAWISIRAIRTRTSLR